MRLKNDRRMAIMVHVPYGRCFDRSTDRTAVSGTANAGSIPARSATESKRAVIPGIFTGSSQSFSNRGLAEELFCLFLFNLFGLIDKLDLSVHAVVNTGIVDVILRDFHRRLKSCSQARKIAVYQIHNLLHALFIELVKSG